MKTSDATSTTEKSGDSTRDKLLAEVLALQARLKRTDEEGSKPADAKKASN